MPVSGAFTTEPLGAAAFAGAAAGFDPVGSGTGAALARLCGAAADAIRDIVRNNSNNIQIT
jgi:hypothetical protein